jgi:hypothetical protein
LYVGPFLDGFFLKGAPEFERWATMQRKRLAERCAQALEQLAVAAVKLGDQRRAIEWWQRAVDLNPFDTNSVLRLAQAGSPWAIVRLRFAARSSTRMCCVRSSISLRIHGSSRWLLSCAEPPVD